MNRFTQYNKIADPSLDEPVSAEDQQWLDNEVLEDRRVFPDFVFQHHQNSRFSRYE
jgi:hypothetical protein